MTNTTTDANTRTVTFLNTTLLREANDEAIRSKRNRAIADELIDKLDPDGLHLITWQMLHNDVEVRCMIYCKVVGSDEPVTVWLDMHPDVYFALPQAEVPVDA